MTDYELESPSFIRLYSCANMCCLANDSNVSFTLLINPMTNCARFSPSNGRQLLEGPTKMPSFCHLLNDTDEVLSVMLLCSEF